MTLGSNAYLLLGLTALVAGLVAILVFAMLYSPLSQLLGIRMNMLSRKNEYEADNYARTTFDGTALASASNSSRDSRLRA